MDISLAGLGTQFLDMEVTQQGLVWCAGWFDATAVGQGYKNLMVLYDQSMAVLSTLQFSIGGATNHLDRITDIMKHYQWDYIYGVGYRDSQASWIVTSFFGIDDTQAILWTG